MGSKTTQKGLTDRELRFCTLGARDVEAIRAELMRARRALRAIVRLTLYVPGLDGKATTRVWDLAASALTARPRKGSKK